MKNQWALTVVMAASLCGNFANAQQQSAPLQSLLPSGAEVIETADLTAMVAKPRGMVLWMLRPQRHVYKNQTGGDCSDIAHGDFGEYHEGPTRLSLIDTRQGRVVNTINVLAGCDTCAVSFQIPLCLLNLASDSAGKPNLNLRDMTGEGLKSSFVLMVFEAFQLTSTAVFGYEPKLDRIVQYPIELQGTEKPSLWTDGAFAMEPLGPGHWRFTSAPGHGDLSTTARRYHSIECAICSPNKSSGSGLRTHRFSVTLILC